VQNGIAKGGAERGGRRKETTIAEKEKGEEITATLFSLKKESEARSTRQRGKASGWAKRRTDLLARRRGAKRTSAEPTQKRKRETKSAGKKWKAGRKEGARKREHEMGGSARAPEQRGKGQTR